MKAEITVLVGPRAHPVSGRPSRCPADATAAALALRLNPAARLLCCGDMPGKVARDYLALGATRIDILGAPAHADITTSLLPALEEVPWVLTGTRGADEQASAMLPYRLAAALGRPLVTDVLSAEPDGGGWIITQALAKGARRRLRVTPPAVLAISPASPQVLRHALAAAMEGQILRAPAPKLAATPPHADGQQVPANKRRQVLEARTQQSGHARMLGAIDSPAAGGTVLASGDAQSKAQAVLDYLRRHSLVHF